MTLLETNVGKCINEESVALEEKFKMESPERKFREAIGVEGGKMKAR